MLIYSLLWEFARASFETLIFSELPAFTKAVLLILSEEDYRHFSYHRQMSKAVLLILSEEDYFGLQDLLIDTPDAGDVIPGSKGLRKIRVACGGKGKRGGSRVIYCPKYSNWNHGLHGIHGF